MKTKYKILLLILLILLIIQKSPPENSFKIIKKSIVNIQNQTYVYYKLRLKGKCAPSYAIYYPNKKSNETIMIVNPYEEINWSEEKIDSKNTNIQNIKKRQNKLIFI